MSNGPALLGSSPLFSTKVNIVRPVLPSFDDLAADAAELLSTGMVTKGRHLLDFEEAVAEHLGVRHAIAVSSCTAGLMLTFKCLDLTGEVVIPSFTFMATASSLVWAGLRPVFADVSFHTTNIDIASAEAVMTTGTCAIVAVHNFGNPADLDALQSLADRKGLKLICDAAHGFGALHKGKPVGSQADAQVFSLSPTKLVIAGEGGIVATNDDELAARVRMGREYGNDGKYDSVFPGINARLPEFNALMGLHSLRKLEGAARRRNEVAMIYREELGKLPGIGFQQVEDGNRNSYKDFSITIDSSAFGMGRDCLAAALEAENIDTRKYYDPPVHRQTAYARFASPDAVLDNTDLLALRSLSLPMWSDMSDEIALNICEAIRRAHECAAEVEEALDRSTTASAV
ncbi:MAG TPA: DegT/DnrJ/EryC1/StrS family aminotransferase [Blastocatellia bacterium]|nr:DegT/DnrJ/EryC1/StrS family aminotransferase [Blastocatellia bacterium]